MIRGTVNALSVTIPDQTLLSMRDMPYPEILVNRMGDGLFLHFADACTALSALLTLTQRCSALSTPDTPLWVRTGVHVGPAQRLGADLIGHHVNIAARIGELAAATEVLVSETARAASNGTGVRFDALGPVFVKGLPDPLRLFRASSVDALVQATIP